MKQSISKLVFELFSDETPIVSFVETSKDLSVADVYVRISQIDKDKVLVRLNKTSRNMQTQLFRKMTIKKIPKLIFKLDESDYNEEKIDKILKEIHNG